MHDEHQNHDHHNHHEHHEHHPEHHKTGDKPGEHDGHKHHEHKPEVETEAERYAKAVEEGFNDMAAAAKKAAAETRKAVDEAVSCFEKDIETLGRTVADFGVRKPLVMGLGIVAVASLVFASILGAASSDKRR